MEYGRLIEYILDHNNTKTDNNYFFALKLKPLKKDLIENE